jgi:hypothetical protein
MSYLITPDEVSLARLELFRKKAKAAALDMAIKHSIASTMDDLVFKEASPGTDLSQPAGSGYTNETYITGAIVVNTWTSVFDTALVPVLGARQVAVFYKVWSTDVPQNITAVRFRLGPTGATTLAWFPMEIVNAKQVPEAYFSEPVVFGPSQAMFIECYARVAVPAAGTHLGFGCFIAEPAGEAIS